MIGFGRSVRQHVCVDDRDDAAGIEYGRVERQAARLRNTHRRNGNDRDEETVRYAYWHQFAMAGPCFLRSPHHTFTALSRCTAFSVLTTDSRNTVLHSRTLLVQNNNIKLVSIPNLQREVLVDPRDFSVLPRALPFLAIPRRNGKVAV